MVDDVVIQVYFHVIPEEIIDSLVINFRYIIPLGTSCEQVFLLKNVYDSAVGPDRGGNHA